MENIKEAQASENTDNNKNSTRLSDNIMPHILNLYSSPKPRDFEIYTPDATFEDPLMCAQGVKEIKSAFYSIPKHQAWLGAIVAMTCVELCDHFKKLGVTITKSLTGKNCRVKVMNISVGLNYVLHRVGVCICNIQILVDNKQHYKFLGKDVTMISLITLQVKEGKVVRHEDWWDKKPLWNKDTVKVPVLGRLVEMSRTGSMFATHLLMGFGKDPSP
ncbi:hypothetical protein C5167_046920 [Papaver somniferum]|uniref:Uncharacterized protein n=1 Tax=Papaver somniferum TaxID=3469 RepID=A0A4Y7LF53_PAPSO|nr:hypothetical protein C5167_046920 [Papaver somniferum]